MERVTIIEGDKVDVFFEHCSPVMNATVMGIPYATGDTWKLLIEEDEELARPSQVVYVQTFSKMERKPHA